MNIQNKSMLMAAILLVTIFISGTFSPATAQPVTKEYPYFYKSARAMGMGGAYIAIGGRTDTLFYNPAGLGNMPVGDGWEINILGLTGEINDNVIDFADDLWDAFDLGDVDMDGDEDDDQLRAVNDVLEKYTGDNLHLRLSDFASLGKRTESIAYAFGGLASVKLDGIAHQGLGSNGMLEVNGDAYYGGIGGINYTMSNGLNVGASLKFFYRDALIHTFTARELVDNEDNLEDYITDELLENGSAFGFDVGALYNIPALASLNPTVGLSLMNIGDMDFGDAGVVPMTVNLGFAINPEIPVMHSLLIGLDYVDVFNNFDQDSDVGKRLRFGGELKVLKKKLASLSLRAGLYQGYPTFGADLCLGVVDVNYVTYAEEVGAYAGQDDDRRHLVMINVGW